MTFGEKLGEILEEMDISQKDFAASLSIAPSTLNGYIKNKRQPDFDTVKKIASMLNVSIDFLMSYNGNSVNLSVKELALINKLRNMEDKERTIVYSLVNIISKK